MAQSSVATQKPVQYQHYSTTGGAKNPLLILRNLTLVVTIECYICHKIFLNHWGATKMLTNMCHNLYLIFLTHYV